MAILNLVHINLHVTDLERSIAFYEKLGWRVMFDLDRNEPMQLAPVSIAGRIEQGAGADRISSQLAAPREDVVWRLRRRRPGAEALQARPLPRGIRPRGLTHRSVGGYPVGVTWNDLDHAASVGLSTAWWVERSPDRLAIISPHGDCSLAEKILEHCCRELPTFKLPRSLDFVDEIPRSDAGKILRRWLRDAYVDAAGSPPR